MDMEIVLRVQDYSDGIEGTAKYEPDKDDRKLRKRLAVDLQKERRVDHAGGQFSPLAVTTFCLVHHPANKPHLDT